MRVILFIISNLYLISYCHSQLSMTPQISYGFIDIGIIPERSNDEIPNPILLNEVNGFQTKSISYGFTLDHRFNKQYSLGLTLDFTRFDLEGGEANILPQLNTDHFQMRRMRYGLTFFNDFSGFHTGLGIGYSNTTDLLHVTSVGSAFKSGAKNDHMYGNLILGGSYNNIILRLSYQFQLVSIENSYMEIDLAQIYDSFNQIELTLGYRLASRNKEKVHQEK